MSINGRMDKEDVVHIYNGLLPIKKNEIVPFAEMWMDLESVIQSEVSLTEKKKCHMKYLYVESKKKLYK